MKRTHCSKGGGQDSGGAADGDDIGLQETSHRVIQPSPTLTSPPGDRREQEQQFREQKSIHVPDGRTGHVQEDGLGGRGGSKDLGIVT